MRIMTADGSLEAHVAYPARMPAPVVIVLHEIFGVNADIRTTCAELAAAGFVAVAPELFWRDAPGLDLNSWSEADWERGMDLYRRYDLDRGTRDVADVLMAARSMEGGNGSVGVMGFCLGGLMSYLAAARTAVDAAVVYYGGGTHQHLDQAGSVAVPILMHFGDADEFIPDEARAAIQAAFEGAPTAEIHIYPGCSHAFARHTGTHFDPAAAAAANARTYAFMRKQLGSTAV
jgi:carboxymethylenebutenolidase